MRGPLTLSCCWMRKIPLQVWNPRRRLQSSSWISRTWSASSGAASWWSSSRCGRGRCRGPGSAPRARWCSRTRSWRCWSTRTGWRCAAPWPRTCRAAAAAGSCSAAAPSAGSGHWNLTMSRKNICQRFHNPAAWSGCRPCCRSLTRRMKPPRCRNLECPYFWKLFDQFLLCPGSQWTDSPQSWTCPWRFCAACRGIFAPSSICGSSSCFHSRTWTRCTSWSGRAGRSRGWSARSPPAACWSAPSRGTRWGTLLSRSACTENNTDKYLCEYDASGQSIIFRSCLLPPVCWGPRRRGCSACCPQWRRLGWASGQSWRWTASGASRPPPCPRWGSAGSLATDGRGVYLGL